MCWSKLVETGGFSNVYDSDYVNNFVVKDELCKVLIMFNYKGNIGSI